MSIFTLYKYEDNLKLINVYTFSTILVIQSPIYDDNIFFVSD